MEVAQRLLAAFNIQETEGQIQHTKNRAFNDRRYAVDGTKLRKLGWVQRTSFDDALAITVDWYNRFPTWWGDIEGVLSAHPIVQGDHLQPEHEKTMNGWQGDSEAGAGAERKTSVLQVNGQPDQKGTHAVVGKKRKADLMSDE